MKRQYLYYAGAALVTLALVFFLLRPKAENEVARPAVSAGKVSQQIAQIKKVPNQKNIPADIKNNPQVVEQIKKTIPENLQGKVLELLKKDENYWSYLDELNKIWMALGEDEIGKNTYQLILQSMLVRMGMPVEEIQNINCIKQKECPMQLSKLYSEGLQRLPTHEFPYGKLMIMDHLVASDMSQAKKMDLLTAQLGDQDIQNSNQTSQVNSSGQLEVSDVGYFLIRTQEHLIANSNNPETIEMATFKAINQSSDPIVKTALAVNLIRMNPTNAESIHAQLIEAGVSESEALEIMIGMSQRPPSEPTPEN